MRDLLTTERWDELTTHPELCANKGSEMSSPLLLTDTDVDALAWQFMNSAYADDTYSDWPLDQRLDGFLRRRGLSRIAEDGDAYDLVLNGVMACISVAQQPAR